MLKSLLITSTVLWPTLVIKVLPLSHRVQINFFCTGWGLSDILLRNLGAFFLRNHLSGCRDSSVVRSACLFSPKDQSLVPSTLLGLPTTNTTPVLGDLTYCYGSSWLPEYPWNTFIASHANLQKKKRKSS